MPQTVGLLHFIAIIEFIFSGHNVNHRHSPNQFLRKMPLTGPLSG
jgi:hypothetical protein